MTKIWSEIKQEFSNALTPKVGSREANSIFRLTFDHYKGIFQPTKEDLTHSVTAKEQKEIADILTRLLQDEPIQYILGYTWFYDLKFAVNPHVLIPRQETEELVHWIINSTTDRARMRILDLGTGSGTIGLSLAKHTQLSRVICSDVSADAVAVAKTNGESFGLENVDFQVIDILDMPEFPFSFDLIVSNPPYVDLAFKAKMPKNVIEHEPNIALFAPESDPLLFFRRIGEYGLKNLKPYGLLFFEINEFYKDELVEMLEQQGYKNIEAKKDLNGKWRMMKVGI